MDIKEYFGNYDKNNFEQLTDYMNKLNNNLTKIYNFGFPFMKGNNEVNFGKFLETKKLNRQSLSSDFVFQYISSYFENLPNWNNPGTMINVIPPVNLTSVSAVNIANLYNPNLAQDTYSGKIILTELEVSKYLSDLIGWDWKNTHGTFTFGGKGTNLYAAKVALNKINPDYSTHGLDGKKYFMVTSKNGHPCHHEVCNWIGIGSDNCIEIDCNENGQIDVNLMEEIIEKNINDNKIFLGYNLTAGSTNELIVDDIKKISELNEKIVRRHNLNYKPHIHADAVLGWVYLFFNDYDFVENKLQIDKEIIKKIESMNLKIKNLKYADSIGVDFHKTAFCPYISSIVLFKNKEDYYTLYKEDNKKIDEIDYGTYNPYHSTLELTRSSTGPLSALCSLKSLGIEGFQKIIANMFSCAEYFRNLLKMNPNVEIINKNTEGLATLFILKPEKYKDRSLNDIKKLSLDQIEEIKEYNVNFGKYIYQLACENKIDFVFTSSRSYVLPNTNLRLGALKTYPMSVHMNYEIVEKIVNDINLVIKNYKNDNCFNKHELSDNMVYR